MSQKRTNPVREVRKTLLEKIAMHEARIVEEQKAITRVRAQLDIFDRTFIDYLGSRKAAAVQVKKRKAQSRGKKKMSKTVRNTNRATEGRRAVAQGLRPKISDAMIIIMGTQTMNASQLYEALQQKGWLPSASDPRQYLNYIFAKNPDLFERVARGAYRVKASAVKQAVSDTDATLAEIGVGPVAQAS